ncbi:hypothetical protein AVEN_14520-1 [Araneus ventricosus]|uniref:Reverse transcriptase domain-containing protein n=1 Tax=Araneus ventricosus TaxID=182803 RepID=A0A4Y2CGM5_ARAVE|nr:hypothetical protein AVEN_14520-1 [Araneus ventricosus]
MLAQIRALPMHWVQTCPCRLAAGHLPSQNPASPNFDPPKEENQQRQLPTDKYDVGELIVEPQSIVLNSDLPVSLRPYSTSPVEEQEVKSEVEKLLQAGLITESNIPYSCNISF